MNIVIVGGGVVGSAVAWQLRQDGFAGRIIVIERDASYRRASSYLAMGGIRQQFCTPVTVRMVQDSLRLWRDFDTTFGNADAARRAWFRPRGYLFLADQTNADRLQHRYEDARRAGASVRRLTVDEMRNLVPDVMFDDIRFGVFGPEDGYANPKAVLAAFRRAAEGSGVEYRQDEAVAIDASGGRVAAVRLASGESISSRWMVNAAGPWAGHLAALAGLNVPIAPVRQMLFRCDLPQRWPYRFPMLIDPGGVHWRHDDPMEPGTRDGIILAFTNWAEEPGENFESDAARWARDFYPAMVRRLPALKAVSNVTGWAGLYEMTPDHNPVFGCHPALDGFIFASGFSGHGLMMSPAAAKIVSEVVRLGRSETFDVECFAPDRFERGALVHDAATI
jgi:glycine/D-amino acid oxidase-like deaminating enzyme